MYKNTLETTPIKYKTYKLPKTQTRIGMGLCLLPMAIGVLPPVCGSPNDGVAGQIILFSFFLGRQTNSQCLFSKETSFFHFEKHQPDKKNMRMESGH
jgi:hypothetical protein